MSIWITTLHKIQNLCMEEFQCLNLQFIVQQEVNSSINLKFWLYVENVINRALECKSL
jgi:hypothetical protein